MTVHIFSPSIQEVEAGIGGEPGPHRELQDNQDYT